MVSKLVYRDFDEFAAALVGIEGGFIPTARQTAEWWIERVDGNWLQAFQTGGPATFAGQGKSGSFTVATPITPPGHLRVGGQPLEPDEFVLFHESPPFAFAGQDVVCWVAITTPENTSLIAPELLPRADSGPRRRTSQTYLDGLRDMVSHLIFGNEPFDVSEPAAAMAAAQEVVLYLAHVLEHSVKPSDRRATRPPLSRSRVITRTLALIDGHRGEPLFIGDLCRATQVSERTLRNIFCDHFGVGPMRLLKAIQLHNIRMALLRADPERDTVTRVAGRFGIWDFSLFARNYKAMFDELPSKTLRSSPPAGPRSRHSAIGWLHYASRIVIDGPATAA